MPQALFRPTLVPAVLTVALAAAACGASSPTAPQPVAAELQAGHYTLMLYGTATCVTANGDGNVPSAASVAVVLEAGERPGSWRLSAPGQSLAGEVGIAAGAVEGYVRGSALSTSVRLTTGVLPDETVAFTGTAGPGRYAGAVLAGTPRFEGIGASSGVVTTCVSNGFTLQPA